MSEFHITGPDGVVSVIRGPNLADFPRMLTELPSVSEADARRLAERLKALTGDRPILRAGASPSGKTTDALAALVHYAGPGAGSPRPNRATRRARRPLRGRGWTR